MCGIIGYVGSRQAEPILLEGLRRLEYRGYDSAGVATLAGPTLHVRKKAGRIADLTAHLRDESAPGTLGVGHTRWATHGRPSDRNAHPHVAGHGRRRVAVVHNGVIENFAGLRQRLQRRRRRFHQRHRHRGHRPPDRPSSEGRSRRGRCRRSAVAQGHLRPGGRQPGPSRRDRRRPPGQSAGGRASATASTSWPATRRPWPVGPTRSSTWHDHQLCVLTPTTGTSSTASAWSCRRLTSRRRPRPRRPRQGRVRALHAQGDLRAARGAGERPARPARRRRRHGPLRRPEPGRAPAARRSSGSS